MALAPKKSTFIVFAMVAAGFCRSDFLAPGHSPALALLPSQTEDAFFARLEQRTFDSVNRERLARGLTALQRAQVLEDAARRHSRDMAERGYIDHVNPDGYSVADRARLAGLRRARKVAENLGKHRAQSDPVETIVRGWMNSPHHRDNIVNDRYKYTGLGVARAADGTLYFTQLFADRP